MLEDKRKMAKYEVELCTYIIKLSDKPEWSKNDFHKIYNKIIIFMKKAKIDEINLLNSGFFILKQSNAFKVIDFDDYNKTKSSFRRLIDEIPIPEAIACIACITKNIITDNKLNFIDLKSEVDEK